jgi:Flp pilus assembly protein TadB
MSTIVAALCMATCFVGLAGLLVPPRPRLGPRLRPHIAVTRARLGRPVDPGVPADAGTRHALVRIARAANAALVRFVDRRSDEALERSLAHAGMTVVTPADHRARVVLAVAAGAACGAAVGAFVLHSALFTLGLLSLGAVGGGARVRARVDRAIAERRHRMRLELYTVNQLLAMHVRTGAGPIQATQRVVDRAAGVFVGELAAVLRLVRNGTSEPEAFRAVAARTAEPAASRTLKLFATGAERGIDLGGALRAASEDLRDARRDEMRRAATKRRAAMLVPTIAVLAPVMLLFIVAPLPSIVFGAR